MLNRHVVNKILRFRFVKPDPSSTSQPSNEFFLPKPRLHVAFSWRGCRSYRRSILYRAAGCVVHYNRISVSWRTILQKVMFEPEPLCKMGAIHFVVVVCPQKLKRSQGERHPYKPACKIFKRLPLPVGASFGMGSPAFDESLYHFRPT